MSLDGINTKVAIHRAADIAKEVASQQKKAEFSNIVRQTSKETDIGRTPIEDIYKPDEATIRDRDERKNKKFKREDNQKKKEEEKYSETPEASSSKIDIRI